jgi:hypothetical protein
VVTALVVTDPTAADLIEDKDNVGEVVLRPSNQGQEKRKRIAVTIDTAILKGRDENEGMGGKGILS